MLEQLNSRFELVVEALSGIGGRIETLRGEMVEQFAEVGKQIRFLSQQIGENRDGLSALRAELTAEMVRLGEALGATRVEFRQQFTDTHSSIRQEITDGAQRAVSQMREQMAAGIGAARTEFPQEVAASAQQTRESMRSGITELHDGLRSEIARRTEAITRQLSGELKSGQKSLAALSKKFDRFDDRVSVQVKDQEQRLRKLERRARG
jgi:hypothetical protein